LNYLIVFYSYSILHILTSTVLLFINYDEGVGVGVTDMVADGVGVGVGVLVAQGVC